MPTKVKCLFAAVLFVLGLAACDPYPAWRPWLDCVASHESATAGGYAAVSPGGTYRGRYQFDQGTWNHAAEESGHPEWVGRPANEAPGWVQDDAAVAHASHSGSGPWNGICESLLP